jgi:hypothetical protein
VTGIQLNHTTDLQDAGRYLGNAAMALRAAHVRTVFAKEIWRQISLGNQPPPQPRDPPVHRTVVPGKS